MPLPKGSMGRLPSHGGYHMFSGREKGSLRWYKVGTIKGPTSSDLKSLKQ